MRVLLYAHADAKRVKQYVRHALRWMDPKFDLVVFLTPCKDAEAALADLMPCKLRVVHTPKRWTNEQRYLHGMRVTPEAATNSALCWMDDSVIYLYDLDKLFQRLQGKSDWWALSLSRAEQVHAEKQLIYFDRQTGKTVARYCAGVSLTGDAALDSKRAITDLSSMLIRQGFSLSTLIRPKDLAEPPNTPTALLRYWHVTVASDLPCLDARLASDRWRLDNFGLALPEGFTFQKLYRHLKSEHVAADLDLGAVLTEARK